MVLSSDFGIIAFLLLCLQLSEPRTLDHQSSLVCLMLTLSISRSLYLLRSYRGCRHLKFVVYPSAKLSRASCVKLLLSPSTSFFCFTLQVIVILELCSNQPHEACGVDLGARRISG